MASLGRTPRRDQFRVAVLQGVFTKDNDGELAFRPLIAPLQTDIAPARLIKKLLRQRGLVCEKPRQNRVELQAHRACRRYEPSNCGTCTNDVCNIALDVVGAEVYFPGLISRAKPVAAGSGSRSEGVTRACGGAIAVRGP